MNQVQLAILCSHFQARDLTVLMQSPELNEILAECKKNVSELKVWQNHCRAMESEEEQLLATFGELDRPIRLAKQLIEYRRSWRPLCEAFQR